MADLRETIRTERLRLVAEDVAWTWGEGADVRGSSEAFMLVLSGRPIKGSDVSGPGAVTLLQRVGGSR